MSKIAHVVDGEASESESEVELAKAPELETRPPTDFVITGEASESDDESKIVPSTAPVHGTPKKSVPSQPNTMANFNYNSLLHQKLWESNVSLRASIEGLLHHTTELAIDKLSRCDKTLLTVQESMRATNASLTLARARLKQVHTGLENANCAAAFPTVRTS